MKRKMDRKFLPALTKVTLMVMVLAGLASCKNQKKLTELSDQDEKAEVNDSIDSDVEVAEEAPNDNNDSPEERIVKKEPTKESKLNNYFSSISQSASTTSANASIQEALTMFRNPDAPVLLVIYKADGKPSYDEPTTIEKYLNYLKDTKNKAARVEEVVYDGNGKIKELVLRK